MYIYIYRVYGGSGPLAFVTLQSRKAAKMPHAAKPQSRKAAYERRRRKAAKPQSREAAKRTSTLRSLKAAKPQSEPRRFEASKPQSRKS